jgi:hypothetical protein
MYNLVNLLNAAQFEREMISKRVTDALKQKKELGSKLGKVPYGYYAVQTMSNNGVIRTFEKDPFQQQIIEFINLCRTSGTTLKELNLKMEALVKKVPVLMEEKKEEFEKIVFNDRSKIIKKELVFQNIADLLNSYGIPFKPGKSWQSNSVRSIYIHSLEEKISNEESQNNNNNTLAKKSN